jgi:hypothetical protein
MEQIPFYPSISPQPLLSYRRPTCSIDPFSEVHQQAMNVLHGLRMLQNHSLACGPHPFASLPLGQTLISGLVL